MIKKQFVYTRKGKHLDVLNIVRDRISQKYNGE